MSPFPRRLARTLAALGAGSAALAGSIGFAAARDVHGPGTRAAASKRVPAGPVVAVYVTSANVRQRLAPMAPVYFRGGPGHGRLNIVVGPNARLQTLTAGFGLAMTDTSAWLLHDELPRRLRDQVMHRLFSLGRGGIGLSYLRVPIGASDYVVGQPYTYDDLPPGQGDPYLKRFSLGHDRAYILPMIRQARALNPALTIMANPWSPPAWMKTDDSIIPTGPTSSTLRPDAYSPFAQYLVKFLKGYAKAGVPIQQLGVANEPLNTYFTQSFPQMYLSAPDEARLIAGFVGPALRGAHLHPQILAWDDAYPKAALADPESLAYIPTVLLSPARRDIGGLAFHCYFSDADAGSRVHRHFPRLAQFETECASYLSDITPAQMAIRVLRNWAQGVQLWNVAVDEEFGPKVGQGCEGQYGPRLGEQCIAPVIVNRVSHTYRLTSDFWQLAQFSRFIRLGARRIYSTTPDHCADGLLLPAPPCGVEDVAFRNPDGTIVLVATTNNGRAHHITVTERGRSFSYVLHDGEVATFVWRG